MLCAPSANTLGMFARSFCGPDAMAGFYDKPCASNGLNSFRYRGDYGWIMIGAQNQNDALHEALRSLSCGPATLDRLERWCILSGHYIPC